MFKNVQDNKMAKSASFVADLPPAMTPEHLEKLYNWGKSSCLRFDVHMGGDESMTLVATRKKEATARDHMRLLLTCLRNWGVDVPKRSGWLRLVGHSDEAFSDKSEETQEKSPDKNVAAPPNVASSEFPSCPAALCGEAHAPTEQDAGAALNGRAYRSAASPTEDNARVTPATTPPRAAPMLSTALRAPLNLLSKTACAEAVRVH